MLTTLDTLLSSQDIYKQLKLKCEENQQYSILSLVSDVGNFAINRLKTVIKNMPEFTLHDETHIFGSSLNQVGNAKSSPAASR